MTILEPFQYEFFQIGTAIAVVAGALCGVVGVYVVLRSMSYIGHGLSHAIFGWAVLSSAVGINLYVGAATGGLLSALAVTRVGRRRGIGADAAIGVITISMFAAGIAYLSQPTVGFTRNFEAVLFGQILGVGVRHLVIISIVAVFVIGLILANYRSLLFSTFDPEVAAVSGIKVGRLDALLALVLAVTIVATMEALGVTLIAAALVIPPVTARLMTDSFGKMLVTSSVIGAAAGFIGMYVSYYMDIASGASIVLVSAVIFVMVYSLAGRRRSLAPAAH